METCPPCTVGVRTSGLAGAKCPGLCQARSKHAAPNPSQQGSFYCDCAFSFCHTNPTFQLSFLPTVTTVVTSLNPREKCYFSTHNCISELPTETLLIEKLSIINSGWNSPSKLHWMRGVLAASSHSTRWSPYWAAFVCL